MKKLKNKMNINRVRVKLNQINNSQIFLLVNKLLSIFRVIFRNKSFHGSKRSANITLLNCFCEDADFFLEDFGFRERFFRGVYAGMQSGLGLCGIDEEFFI